MAREGSNSRNFSIRLPEGLIKRIDVEVNTFQEESSRSEFIVDAIKFYLRYKEDSRKLDSDGKKIPPILTDSSQTTSGRS